MKSADKNIQDIYLYQNEQLHLVPSINTFYAKGWDFGKIKLVDAATLKRYPIGANVETVHSTSEKLIYDFRIVVSLTTSPKRIRLIETTIYSILNQTVPPSIVQVNIPHKFSRTEETFPPLDEIPILNDPRVRVRR